MTNKAKITKNQANKIIDNFLEGYDDEHSKNLKDPFFIKACSLLLLEPYLYTELKMAMGSKSEKDKKEKDQNYSKITQMIEKLKMEEKKNKKDYYDTLEDF